MIILNAKLHGLSLVNRVHQDENEISTAARLWDRRGVIFYELLKPSETITGERYRLQLIRLNQALKEKGSEWENGDKIILLHDIARPHIHESVKYYLRSACGQPREDHCEYVKRFSGGKGTWQL